MIPNYRLFEVIVYSIMNFLPYMILAVYPFRDRLRFSRKITVIIIFILNLIQVGIGIEACFFLKSHVAILSLISTLTYGFFYFGVIEAPVGKIIFTLLMLSNIANLIVISSKCIEGILFPVLAKQYYRWSFSLVMFFVQGLILGPLFFYIKKTYTPDFIKKTNGKMNNYLWLIPATFYLIWYQSIYGNNMTSLETALLPKNAILLFLIDAGSFLIYHMVVMLVKEQAENSELEAQNYQLAMQSLQFENLKERMNEVRKAKHDMRHHFITINDYLEKEQYNKLKEYIQSYMKIQPEESTLVYCENQTVNAIMVYFSQIAKKNDIEYNVKLAWKENLNISDIDLTVLIGNLIENAVDACMSQKKTERKIRVFGKMQANTLILTVDNTYENHVKLNGEGTYVSTKHAGTGIGIMSVENITERYNGCCMITQEKGWFKVSVLLYLGSGES